MSDKPDELPKSERTNDLKSVEHSSPGLERVNPYQAPPPSHPAAPINTNSRDHSIAAEPWFHRRDFSATIGDPHAVPDSPATWSFAAKSVSERELAENSVWDEPAWAGQTSMTPNPAAVTWFRYYEKQVARTSALQTWLCTCGILLLAGPVAILGTIFNGFVGDGFWMLVLFGPTIEELLKIALPLWVVEKRPWLFSSSLQIFLCGVGAGLAFAAIENIVYLNLYVPNPTPSLIAWKWTVCVALHTGCSAIASFGLISVRQNMFREAKPPQLSRGGPWIIAAIVLHGVYNLLAILLG